MSLIRKLFRPSIALMNRLKYRWKFLTIAALFLLPLGLVMSNFLSEINGNIGFAKNESVGGTYFTAVERFMRAAERLESVTVSAKLGTKPDTTYDEAESSFNHALADLKARHSENGATYKDSEQWTALEKAAGEVTEKGRTWDVNGAIAGFGAVQDKSVDLINQVGSASQLILDPIADSYFTMDTVMDQWPVMLQKEAELRQIALQHAGATKLDAATKTHVTVLETQLSGPDGTISSDIDQGKAVNAEVEQVLRAPSKELDAATQAIIKLFDKSYVSGNPSSVSRSSAAQLFNAFDGAMDAYQSAGATELQRLLQKRIGGMERQKLIVTLFSAGYLVLAAYLFVGFMLGTDQAVKALVGASELARREVGELGIAMRALASGDLTHTVTSSSQKIALESRDEMSDVGRMLQEVIEASSGTVEAYGVSRKSLMELISQIQANTGQVKTSAQSLTDLAQEVGASSGQIHSSVEEVSASSAQAAQGVSEISAGTASQAKSLSQSGKEIERLSEGVQAITDGSSQAVSEAQRAAELAQAGRQVVQESVKAMGEIRTAVSHGSGVINELGDSSEKIGTIVQTISQIAEQTNLLALNAAIEAARAGESGRGFAVVADEVRKLAERSAVATLEIERLIHGIQSQTSDAVVAMQDATKQTEGHATLAEEAAGAFDQIVEVFGTVKEQIEGIHRSSQEMARASNEIGRSITDATAIAEEFSAATEELSASADEVNVSIGVVAGAAQSQSRAADELVASSTCLLQLAEKMSNAAALFKTNDDEGLHEGETKLARAA